MNIELYTYSTPNGHKASIMLEETRLPYRACVVDIEKGEQHDPNFLVLNPNGKIPVIVDHETGLTVFESGAILLYLAEKSGKFLPRTRAEHSRTLQWLFFQIGHIDDGTVVALQGLRAREDSFSDQSLRARGQAAVQGIGWSTRHAQLPCR